MLFNLFKKYHDEHKVESWKNKFVNLKVNSYRYEILANGLKDMMDISDNNFLSINEDSHLKIVNSKLVKNKRENNNIFEENKDDFWEQKRFNLGVNLEEYKPKNIGLIQLGNNNVGSSGLGNSLINNVSKVNNNMEKHNDDINKEKIKSKYNPDLEYMDLMDTEYLKEIGILKDENPVSIGKENNIKLKSNFERISDEGVNKKFNIIVGDRFMFKDELDKYANRNFNLRERIAKTHDANIFVSIAAWNVQSLNAEYVRRQVKLEFLRDMIIENKFDMIFIIDANDRNNILTVNGYNKYTDNRNILFVKASFFNKFIESNNCIYDPQSKLAFMYITPNCRDKILMNNFIWLIENGYIVIGDINFKSNKYIQNWVYNFVGEDSLQTGFISKGRIVIRKYNAICAPSDHAFIYGHAKVNITLDFPMRLMQISEDITCEYVADICRGIAPAVIPKVKPVQYYLNLNDREKVINVMLEDYMQNALASIYKRYRRVYFTGTKEPFLGINVNDNIIETFAKHLKADINKKYIQVPKVSISKVFDNKLALWGTKSKATTFDFMELKSIAIALRDFIRENNRKKPNFIFAGNSYLEDKYAEFFGIADIINNVIEVANIEKEASICNTFFLMKNKRLADFNDVRMIVIIPAFVKIFEFLIYNLVAKYFADYFNDINKVRYQFGALKGGSTYTAMLNLRMAMEDCDAKGVLFIDLTKGFDCVDMKILERCINQYIDQLEVKEVLLAWLAMVTNLDLSMHNKRVRRSRGLPMGLTLSPLLFEFYVDCALADFNKKLLTAFMDDMAMLLPGANTLDQNLSLIEDLRKSLADFFLIINNFKTGFISDDPEYRKELKNEYKLVDKEKYLGRVVMLNGDGKLIADNRYFNKKAFRAKACPYWANFFCKRLIFNNGIMAKFAYKVYMFSGIDKSIRTAVWRNAWCFFRTNMGKFSYMQVVFSVINFFRFFIDGMDYKRWKDRLLQGDRKDDIVKEVKEKLRVEIPQLSDAIDDIVPYFDLGSGDLFYQTRKFNNMLFKQFRLNMLDNYIKKKKFQEIKIFPKIKKYMESKLFSHFGFLQNIVLLHVDDKRRNKQVAIWLFLKVLAVKVNNILAKWNSDGEIPDFDFAWATIFDAIEAETDKEMYKDIADWNWDFIMSSKFRELWNFVEDILLIYSNSRFKKKKDKDDKEKSKLWEGVASIYSDGSYNNANNKIGFGGVLIDPEGGKQFFEGFEYDGENTYGLKNIYGELRAAILGVEAAIARGFTRVNLCYDYLGVEKYALFEWASANDFVGEYVGTMRELRAKININFVKIYSHTGDRYNDLADEISKRACGIKIGAFEKKKSKLSEEELIFFRGFYKKIFKALVIVDVVWMNNLLNNLSVSEFIYNMRIKLLNLEDFSEKMFKAVLVDEIDFDFSDFNDLIVV